MEEQNILTGDQAVLEQIIGEVKKHNQNCARFDGVNAKIKDLSRSINAAEDQVKEAIDDKIKESTSAICSGYDKTIAKEKDKIKNVMSQRDKAKMAGVRERIANETADLREENDGLSAQISEAFRMERVPMFCSSRFFLAIFYTHNFADVCLFILSLLVLYGVVSVGLFFIPGMPLWAIMLCYFVLTTVVFLIYKLICSRTIYKHLEAIDGAFRTRIEMTANRKKIKRIIKHIKHDKNEDMYGLHSYDQKINTLHDNISRVEEEKEAALQKFDETVKQDIIAEIDGRDREKINAMKSQLAKSKQEQSQLEQVINEETIRISSKYEAYLGKNISVDALMELLSVMKSGAADTIGQALSVTERKH